MTNPLIEPLNTALQQVLSDAQVRLSALPDLPLQLWLINPDTMHRPMSHDEVQNIFAAPPYWSFCWASGLALAQWLLAHPEQVAGKRVIDVGSGSGIVALAAKLAGAHSVVACDLDPVALQACRANAALNNLELEYSADLFSETQLYDVLLAADVLYDPDNVPLVERFPEFAEQFIITDSRQRDFQHPLLRKEYNLHAETLPDLGEPLEFREVSLYRSHP